MLENRVRLLNELNIQNWKLNDSIESLEKLEASDPSLGEVFDALKYVCDLQLKVKSSDEYYIAPSSFRKNGGLLILESDCNLYIKPGVSVYKSLDYPASKILKSLENANQTVVNDIKEMISEIKHIAESLK